MMTQEEYNSRYEEIRREKQRQHVRNYMAAHKDKFKVYWKNWAAEHPGYFSAEARALRKAKREKKNNLAESREE